MNRMEVNVLTGEHELIPLTPEEISEIENRSTILPPTPSISFAQLLIALVKNGWITEAEGDGWLIGSLPGPVLEAIAQLPEGERFAAKARAIRPSVIDPADPTVLALAAKQNISTDDLRQFFIWAATL